MLLFQRLQIFPEGHGELGESVVEARVALIFGALMGFINSVQQIFADIFHAPGWFPAVFAGVGLSMAVSAFINSRIVERFGTLERIPSGFTSEAQLLQTIDRIVDVFPSGQQPQIRLQLTHTLVLQRIERHGVRHFPAIERCAALAIGIDDHALQGEEVPGRGIQIRTRPQEHRQGRRVQGSGGARRRSASRRVPWSRRSPTAR